MLAWSVRTRAWVAGRGDTGVGESGSFACPECGNELGLKGTTAGRQLRCGWCRNGVEVPFLPRAVIRRARFSKGRRPKWVIWAWAGVAVVALLVAVFGTRGSQGAEPASGWGNLVAAITEAEAEEHAGRFESAVRAIQEGAGPGGSARFPVRLGWRSSVSSGISTCVGLRSLELESAARAARGEAIATYKALLAHLAGGNARGARRNAPRAATGPVASGRGRPGRRKAGRGERAG